MRSGSVYLIGTAFALFFAVLLATKPRRRLADRILCIWLVIIAVHLMDHSAYRIGLKVQFPHLLGLGDGLALLYGPCLFLYVRSLAQPDRRLHRIDALHALPFVLHTLIYLPLFLASPSEKARMFETGVTDVPYLLPLAIAAKLVSLPVYLVFVFRALRSYSAAAERYYAGSEPRNLRWLYFVSVAMAVFWLVIMGSIGAEAVWGKSIPGGEADGVIFVAVVAGVIALGYFGFRQGTVFDFSPEPDIAPQTNGEGDMSTAATDAVRYQRSGLSEADARGHLDRLTGLMEAERLYLNADLSIDDVARRVGISRHHLTQVLNEYSARNFYMFVNEYRVRDACRRMIDPSHAHQTALAIGLESGFNSKSSFNAAFKRLTSMTPSEYRRVRAGGS